LRAFKFFLEHCAVSKEFEEINKLFKKLLSNEKHLFPKKYVRTNAPTHKGVYIIYNPEGKVVHVGSTPRGKNGLSQRLRNHLSGSSSFCRNYLKGDKTKLRERYKYKYIVIDTKTTDYKRKIRLLESYTIGKLCPKHLGVG